MENNKVVVALGRSAFGDTFPEQKINVKKAAKAVADIIEEGYQVIVTHSNGQQIGLVHAAMSLFSKNDSHYTTASMSLCSAMSQGYIGYDLQNAIRTELLNRGIFKPVSTIITQVQVSPFDAAFSKPTKLIGRLLTKEEAEELKKAGKFVKKVEGGYRRIVGAPVPIDIYEIDAIKTLVDAGQIVIAAGGGGIPVLEQGTALKGASAVIEKDLTAGMLAQLTDSTVLVYLTGAEKACAYFGTEKKEELSDIRLDKIRKLKEDGAFGDTGMLPKITASISFLEAKLGGRVVITDMEHAVPALKGKTGTTIHA